MRVAHERGHLGGGVALVEVDAPGVDDHGNVVDRADRGLKAVTGHGTRGEREALDVAVVDAAHGAHEPRQVPEAAPQHDGDGVLDARLARSHGVLGDHADPLPREPLGKDALARNEPSGIRPIVDEADPARRALCLEHGQRDRRAAGERRAALGAEGKLGGHVTTVGEKHAPGALLRRRPRHGQARRRLGAHAHDVDLLGKLEDLVNGLGAPVIADGGPKQAGAYRDAHVYSASEPSWMVALESRLSV